MTSAAHAQPTSTGPTASAGTRIHLPVWAWLLALLALGVLYLITQDNGAILAQLGDTTHEFFHDARHALGVPCH
jgi:hypothetical protein